MWVASHLNSINTTLQDATRRDMEKVESHWVSLPSLETFRKGNKAAFREFLLQQPLIVALLDRQGDRTLWIRKGDSLEVSKNSPEELKYRRWISESEAAQRFQWTPPKEINGNPNIGPIIVLLGDRWIVIKRWKLGSPEVERALQLVFGPNPQFRFGLRSPGGEKGNPRLQEAWGAEPNLQADPARLIRPLFASVGTSNAFEGWELVAMPFSQHSNSLIKSAIRQRWVAVAGCALVGLSLVLGLWLRYRAKQKAALDADRLASLTHSLKTPLAILKFRCDSIRLGRLTPDQTDAHLIKLSEEVDHLNLIIENGLTALRGAPESGSVSVVNDAWITKTVLELAPAFEAEGRSIKLQLVPDQGKSDLSSLRTALFTLLENALFHGAGEVVVESSRKRRRLQIRVRDQGKGLARHQVEALGKPFLRLRQPEQEGFSQEGQGLGLSLLCQVAEREGWGLSFASESGQGFEASLEIPAT